MGPADLFVPLRNKSSSWGSDSIVWVFWGLLLIFRGRDGGWKGFSWGGGVNVGMLVVVILRRIRNYFILHFPTSNLYNCRIAVTSEGCKFIQEGIY